MKKHLVRSFQAFLMVMLLIISTVVPLTIAPDLALAGTPTNVALHKTTSQSSNYRGDDNSAKAVDGNTDGNYFRGSVTATDNKPQDWWQVDLGDVYDIDTIRLYNRTECCGERLSNFAVMVASEPFTTEQNFSKALAQSTWSQKFPGTVGVKEDFQVKSSGRYVRVQMAGTNYLSLAEVEVFGTPTQAQTGAVWIDASQNNQNNPVVQSLKAGTYKVHLLSTSEGGKFEAWNSIDVARGCDSNGKNCDNGWETRYYFKSPYKKVVDSSCSKKFFGSCRYESAEKAAANAPKDVTFTLSKDTKVNFYIYDTQNLDNNKGGVSLKIIQQ